MNMEIALIMAHLCLLFPADYSQVIINESDHYQYINDKYILMMITIIIVILSIITINT